VSNQSEAIVTTFSAGSFLHGCIPSARGGRSYDGSVPGSDWLQSLVIRANLSGSQGYLVIIVRPDSPLKSMTDLVNLAKSNRGGVTYGHLGAGSSFHLTMIALSQSAGICGTNKGGGYLIVIRRANLALTHF
jgi:hypothetical protein